MASRFDPYQVLGLPRGATALEIKRAYRRLAKENHPDWAGAAATPRFLAIQEAYDALTGSESGPATGPGAEAADRPGQAAGRGRAAGARGPFRPRQAGEAPPPGAAPFGTRRGTSGPAGWSRRPRRPPNRATLGSTTYDDAGEPEPLWEGASWYGQATGTYWTINPREYADPRKHGPEYQARARRMAGVGGDDDEVPDLPEDAAAGDAGDDVAGAGDVAGDVGGVSADEGASTAGA